MLFSNNSTPTTLIQSKSTILKRSKAYAPTIMYVRPIRITMHCLSHSGINLFELRYFYTGIKSLTGLILVSDQLRIYCTSTLQKHFTLRFLVNALISTLRFLVFYAIICLRNLVLVVKS